MNFTSVHFYAELARASVNLEADALGMLLVDATSTISETDKYLSDVVTLGEVGGTGYDRVLLSTVALVTDLTNKKVYLTADPVNWTSVNLSSAVAAAVLYKDGAGDSARLIIGKIDETGYPFSAIGGTPVIIRPSSTDGFVLIKKGV